MIVSKNNLQVVHISEVDKAIPILANVHITKDGTSVASNGKVVLAVSPVHDEVKGDIPIIETAGHSVTISNVTIKEVLKNLPKDTMFRGLLEHCDCDRGKFTMNDGKRTRTIEGKLWPRAYVNFRSIFQKIGRSLSLHRIVLNRKRLLNILLTMEKICPDTSGESPIYLDFTKDNSIIIKGYSNQTGQRVIAIMTSYKDIEGKWLNADSWEKKLCSQKIPIKKKHKG